MSWSSPLLRAVSIALSIAVGPAMLAGCSFSPIYGERADVTGQVQLAYADPVTRLDQVVYRQLALRLGTSSSPDAPLVTISTGVSVRGLTKAAGVGPQAQREVKVRGIIAVTHGDGEVLFSGSRFATATYTTVGQVLADRESEREAAERAATALAETIQLTLLSALAGR